MQRKNLPSKFRTLQNIDQVLNDVVNKLGLNKRLREHALMELWANIFKDSIWVSKTRPLFLDAESNLVITVSNAVIAQELSMQKMQLLKKISTAAAALDIQIKGIRFDLKHFHQSEKSQIDASLLSENTPKLPKASKQELDLFSLSDSEKQELFNFRKEISERLQEDKNSLLTENRNSYEELIERTYKAFEKALKLRSWQRAAGYPICAICGNPGERLFSLNNNGGKMSCFICYMQSK